MNEAIYQMADSGGSIRIVVQKKTDGNYIIGNSNGRDRPLICQGPMEKANAEFENSLPTYLEELKNAAIEAKLRAAEEPPAADDDEEDIETENTAPAIPTPVAVSSKPEEQPELDFGF